jgi:hypothetical protein
MRTFPTIPVLAAALLWFAAPQEPAPNPPPQPAEKLAEAQPPGKPERDPFEGVYRLRQRVVDGIDVPGEADGYLVVTQRHMVLSVAATGSRVDRPLVRSSVREWTRGEQSLKSVIKLGFYTDAGGELRVEATGAEEVRRIQIVRGGVHVFQADRSWLEFERIE